MTSPSASHGRHRVGRSLADDRGSGMVAGLALVFSFTFLALVWLARDVDRGVSNRSAAQSIAFQAARSGAQSADVDALRRGAEPVVDPVRARIAAMRTATALFASYGVDGAVTRIVVDGADVTVDVRVLDGSIVVTGSGTVRAERAP